MTMATTTGSNGVHQKPRGRLELVVEQPGKAMLTRQVERGDTLVVGRAPDCDLCLDDPALSRKHAQLQIGLNDLEVRDTSSNGTLADGVVLHKQVARVDFDRPVALGSSVLYVRWVLAKATSRGGLEGQSVPPPPPPPRSTVPPPLPVAPQPPPAPDAPRPRPTLAVNNQVQRPAATRDAADSGQTTRLEAESARLRLKPVPLVDPDADGGAPIELRRDVHRMLLEHLDMNAIDPTRSDDPALRPRVLAALRRIARMLESRMPASLSAETLIGEVADEALGLGPLERLLADPTITEIMVVDAHHIFIERGGRLTLSGARFTDEERVRAAIERIVTPLGRRIDESSPLVDARLADGSRVNVVIRPLALRGSCITIRKFARTPITIDKLLEYGALSTAMARFLDRSVRAKKNIVIAGGTGSGKTTLLNVLSAAIPEDERIVTIEDAAELQLTQPHVVSLESRPANMEGKGAIAIRELVKNALRMRPDRIVVGECRGGETLDMLQAMNTGHDGSLTTTHANSPQEALARLETLALMAGVALPARAIREQIDKSVHLVVQQARLSDGTRKVTAISELAGMDPDGTLRLRPLFEFVRTGTGAGGKVEGSFEATGYLPSFLPELIVLGLVKRGEPFL